MSTIGYVSLVESSVGFSVQLWSVTSFTRLILIHRLQKSRFSPLLHLYLALGAYFGCISAIHQGYQVAFWRPEAVIYNAHVLFYTGLLHAIGMLALPFGTFFLCLDRLCTIRFPTFYSEIHRRTLLYFALCTLSSAQVLMVVVDFVPDLPTTAFTTCRATGCLLPTTGAVCYLSLRYGVATGNVLLGTVFYFMVKRRFKFSRYGHQVHRTILLMMLFAFLFDFCPHITGLVFGLFKMNLAQLVGPYSVLFTSLDAGTCATLYTLSSRRQLEVKPTSDGPTPFRVVHH